MDRWITGELVVAALFVVAWAFPLVVIIGYRLSVVRVRWEEIETTYFDHELAKAFADHPATQFLGVGSKRDITTLRAIVRRQFDRIQAPGRYVVPLALLVIVSALAFWLGHAWVHDRGTPSAEDFLGTMSLSVVMALAGAYVWGNWEVLERVRERNLTPSQIWELCFRWLVAIPVGYAFSLIVVTGAEPALAFVASAFPLKELRRYLRESSLKKLGVDAQALEQQRLHTTIEGVSTAIAARLEELTIYTVLDMAYANPIHVMVKTGVPIRSVLDWMDQSLFRVYANIHHERFLRCGLRCSIDVCEFVDLHYRCKKAKDDRAKADDECHTIDDTCVAALAAKLKMGESTMREFLFRIAKDTQVHYLYHLWYPDGASKELGGDNHPDHSIK